MNPESLKDIPSRSTYNQAPAVDSQRGAAGHGGPASHGGVFAPGSGLGGSPHHILSSDIHVFLVANVLQILVSTSQQPFSQLQSAHVFV